MKRKPTRAAPIIRQPPAGAFSLRGNQPVMSWSIVYSGGSGGGSGATYNAATASRTDVLAAIALTSPGDTVVVPADAGVSWSGGITISGITLRGPGKDAGSPTVVTAGLVTITKHATQLTRMIGFRFEGTDQHVQIGGEWASRAFVIDDCYFYSNGQEWANQTTNGGLWSRCRFQSTAGNIADCFRYNCGSGAGSQGLESWQAASTWGDLDTTGEKNTYFELCTWKYFGEVSVDFDNGARAVVRYCTVEDSGFVSHGGGSGAATHPGQDTSSHGCRQVEFYNNTFLRVDGTVSVTKWHWQRGGSLVFANNAVDDASYGDYPNKQRVRLTVGCPSDPGYPMAYQVGQTTITPDSTPDEPCLFFGNTGSGVTAGLISVSGDSGEGITCSVPGNYIQSGRDYLTTNGWARPWAAYTYPHPLRPT